MDTEESHTLHFPFSRFLKIMFAFFGCLQYLEDLKNGKLKFHYGTINKRCVPITIPMCGVIVERYYNSCAF